MNLPAPRLCRGTYRPKPAANWSNQYVRKDGRYLRSRVEEIIRARPEGATRKQIAKALRVDVGRVSPRIVELERMGIIEPIDTQLINGRVHTVYGLAE